MSIKRQRRVDYLLENKMGRDEFNREWQPTQYVPGRVREVTGDDVERNFMSAAIREYDNQNDSLNDIDRKMVKAVPLWIDAKIGAPEYWSKFAPLRETNVREEENNFNYSVVDVENI